jgi:cyclic pyranopterin monophosphate synthase
VDKQGKAGMVDISAKPPTEREALARGSVTMLPGTMRLIKEMGIQKGDVVAVSRIAGIMAAKKTPELIPLCHPLQITSVSLDITLDEENSRIDIESRVKTVGQTGVEMEALTAVSVAALTIYDMCKAVDKEMVLSGIMLIEKSGGRTGEFRRPPNRRP